MTVMDARTLAVAPERSLDQRMSALEEANRIRVLRAQLKRDLKAGRVNVLDVLEEPPEWAQTMKLFDLLLAVPKLGRVKVHKALNRTRCSPSKTVGGMSQRQRLEVVYYLIWR